MMYKSSWFMIVIYLYVMSVMRSPSQGFQRILDQKNWNQRKRLQRNTVNENIDPLNQIKTTKKGNQRSSNRISSNIISNVTSSISPSTRLKKKDIIPLEELQTPKASSSSSNPIKTIEEFEQELSKDIPQKLFLSYIDDLNSKIWEYTLLVSFFFGSLFIWIGFFLHQPPTSLPSSSSSSSSVPFQSEIDLTGYLFLVPFEYYLPTFLIQRWQNGYDDIPYLNQRLLWFIQEQQYQAKRLLAEQEEKLLAIITNGKKDRSEISAASFRLASNRIISKMIPEEVYQEVLAIRKSEEKRAWDINNRNNNNENQTSLIEFEDLEKLQKIFDESKEKSTEEIVESLKSVIDKKDRAKE